MLPVLIPIAAQLASLFGPKLVGMVAGDSAGKVAQEVVDIAKGVTGKTSPEEALDALQADPDLLMQYKQKVMDNEARLEQMFLADRQDARSRDVEIKKLGLSNRRADVMVSMAFLALICNVLIVWHLHDEMPPELLGFFSTVTGYLMKMIGDAFQFEFGSSRGSKDKDKLMSGNA